MKSAILILRLSCLEPQGSSRIVILRILNKIIIFFKKRENKLNHLMKLANSLIRTLKQV